jgi:hypothetical protein
MPQFRNHRGSGAWISYTEPEIKSGGKRRVIPQSQLRAMAMASSAGGRGRCNFCGQSFSMNYMKSVKITHFQEELVCYDCRKERQLG